MEATFCFVDLAGFTALTEAHGDQVAADLAERFATRASEALAGEGRLVKMIGDAALVLAPTPASALGFVTRLCEQAAAEPGFPILRAGLHHGQAVERGGDVFGAAVNLAARVAAHAAGGQVLATEVVATEASAQGMHVTPLGATPLRHVLEPVRLFAIDCAAGASERVDPVCRMRLSPGVAAGHLSVDGVDYWFCSLDCAAQFAARPAAYLRRTH